MATDKENTPQRRIEDKHPTEKIDWSQPEAPAVPLSVTAGAAKGGITNENASQDLATTAARPLDLDKLEALAKAATPGDWIYQEDSDAYTHILRATSRPNMIVLSTPQDSRGQAEADARFIAAAKSSILALIAQARAAQPVQAGEAVDPILATWPERIWLQNGDIDERQDYDTAREVFGNEMTWCADQIDRFDVEYVRADLCAPVAAQQGAAKAPTAWLATNLDGRGDVGFTKEEAKRRAGEGCTIFFPLYDNESEAASKAPAAQAVDAPSVASAIASMDRGEDEPEEDQPGIFTKDEVLDMLERDLLTDSGVTTLRNGDSLKFPLDELVILANHAAERAFKASASPASTPDASQQVAENLAGRKLSVDVSTGDDDAGNRIFAELTGETGSDGKTLIAIETSRNFVSQQAAAVAAPVEMRIGVSVMDNAATIVVMQPIGNGSVATIYAGTHPKGDSHGGFKSYAAPATAVAATTETPQEQFEEALACVLCEHTKLNEDGLDEWVPRIIGLLPRAALPFEVVPTEGTDPEHYQGAATTSKDAPLYSTRRNAARYLWLTENLGHIRPHLNGQAVYVNWSGTRDALSAAIDAAMRATQQEGGNADQT